MTELVGFRSDLVSDVGVEVVDESFKTTCSVEFRCWLQRHLGVPRTVSVEPASLGRIIHISLRIAI